MEFIHRPYKSGETIAAIATAPGEGGIAIIRICGHEALDVAARLFSGKVKSYESHTAHLGCIRNRAGKKIDEALCLVMRGKRSFAGEETVELHCHGGMVAARLVLEEALQCGARLARPGEFSFKAFMNGKIDLSQAEAIQELIAAKSEKAFEMAGELLDGVLSRKVKGFQQEIVRLAAIVEAWVDFPEEGLEFITQEQMIDDLARVRGAISEIILTFHDGQKIKSGITLCLVGAPNVGKSSLMNALLEKERAIVTPMAGTTRDLIEEEIMLNGLHFRLMDTAGVHATDDFIENEGIRRSQQAMRRADVVLLVLDASKGIQEEEKALLEQVIADKAIAVWNKIDLVSVQKCPPCLPHVVHVSAKERLDLALLKAKIGELIFTKGAPPKEEVVLSNLRHKEALEGALVHLDNVYQGFCAARSPEFMAQDLKEALYALGTILGTNVTEDILTSIFSQFCIGK